VRRVTVTEQDIETVQKDIVRVRKDMEGLRDRFLPLEQQMPLKADRTEVRRLRGFVLLLLQLASMTD
jgi:hypothetical protein